MASISSCFRASLLLLLTAFLVSPAVAEEKCNRDPQQTCECILGCPVFSKHIPAGTWPCSGTEKAVLEAVDKAIVGVNITDKCDGIKCVMGCSRSMNCVDEEIIGRCMNVEQSIDGCDLKCVDAKGGGSIRTGGVGAGLLLGAMLMAATLDNEPTILVAGVDAVVVAAV
eukprot:CAMPEP_0206565728 /NCGR_PEP_ID=MMETSP0325_2-20121206/24246_1 /ASSEMBLY_ACC=CAM_ASM_000347 /TAXON_ID=2866 /ORGANISM="Crypthecodinium cohnii, Strain Seligo" /LENGTH=168 /DNA_ID=CAMNT_0054068643 /DNA_START=35 /DNA_END=539 /DNA_ORIENTATION=+